MEKIQYIKIILSSSDIISLGSNSVISDGLPNFNETEDLIDLKNKLKAGIQTLEYAQHLLIKYRKMLNELEEM